MLNLHGAVIDEEVPELMELIRKLENIPWPGDGLPFLANSVRVSGEMLDMLWDVLYLTQQHIDAAHRGNTDAIHPCREVNLYAVCNRCVFRCTNVPQYSNLVEC